MIPLLLSRWCGSDQRRKQVPNQDYPIVEI
jgi:hypothetical protein